MPFIEFIMVAQSFQFPERQFPHQQNENSRIGRWKAPSCSKSPRVMTPFAFYDNNSPLASLSQIHICHSPSYSCLWRLTSMDGISWTSLPLGSGLTQPKGGLSRRSDSGKAERWWQQHHTSAHIESASRLHSTEGAFVGSRNTMPPPSLDSSDHYHYYP